MPELSDLENFLSVSMALKLVRNEYLLGYCDIFFTPVKNHNSPSKFTNHNLIREP